MLVWAPLALPHTSGWTLDERDTGKARSWLWPLCSPEDKDVLGPPSPHPPGGHSLGTVPISVPTPGCEVGPGSRLPLCPLMDTVRRCLLGLKVTLWAPQTSPLAPIYPPGTQVSSAGPVRCHRDLETDHLPQRPWVPSAACLTAIWAPPLPRPLPLSSLCSHQHMAGVVVCS